MNRPNIQECRSCRSHAERYRNDYPVNDIRAYVLIHARGCSRLTQTQRHNGQRWTAAVLKAEESK